MLLPTGSTLVYRYTGPAPGTLYHCVYLWTLIISNMVWESTRVLYNGPNVYAVEGLYEQQLDPGPG